MNDQSIYENNPLHGLSLENLLNEIVDHYGFEILDAYLNINCFKKNASIESSIKFLKKTDWARENVESFYLYKFKNLPKAPSSQLDTPPRDRIIPLNQKPQAPAELSLEDAAKIRANKAKMAADFNKGQRQPKHYQDTPRSTPPYPKPRSSSSKSSPRKEGGDSANNTSSDGGSVDPWGKWKK